MKTYEPHFTIGEDEPQLEQSQIHRLSKWMSIKKNAKVIWDSERFSQKFIGKFIGFGEFGRRMFILIEGKYTIIDCFVNASEFEIKQ